MPIPQNGQTHSNNSLPIASELFECVDHSEGLPLKGLTSLLMPCNVSLYQRD